MTITEKYIQLILPYLSGPEDGVVEKWIGGINKKEFTSKIKSAAKTRREHIKKELNDTKGT